MQLDEMKPIVKTFYDGLAEGKFLGKQCPECGAVEFPPHLACNACGYHETHWVELSGRGHVLDFVIPGVQNDKPDLKELGKAAGLGAKYAYGTVEIDEGSQYTFVIYGITKKNAADVRQRLMDGKRVGVHATALDRDGWKEPVFVLDELD